MPPRKRRGRAKKALGGGGGSKKQAVEEVQDEEQEVQLESSEVPESGTVDPELLEAQSTIERLARKYLHKSFEVSSHSLDIVKGDSMIIKETEQSEAMEIFSEGSSKEGEEEKENRLDESLTPNISDEAMDSPQEGPATRKRKIPKVKDSTVVIRRVRHPRVMKRVSQLKLDDTKLPLQEKRRKAPFLSPDFKLPQPTLGHSTPGDLGPSIAPHRDSLFGFEALESPLVLSPVHSMSYLADQDADKTTEHNKSLEDGKHKSSSVKKLLGTYDIPLKRPTPRNKKRHVKQKNKRSSVAEDEWIKKLTSEFTEVDDFELAIE